jgi:3-hydroxyacyl-CoA dehydrogenase/enoyl-CoA hydratase/3-hydroxybutyryl-CoA epimerase
MGGDIAAWCALRGLTVTLQDQGMERIAPALQRAYAAYRQRIRDPRELRNVMDRLIPDPKGTAPARPTW